MRPHTHTRYRQSVHIRGRSEKLWYVAGSSLDISRHKLANGVHLLTGLVGGARALHIFKRKEYGVLVAMAGAGSAGRRREEWECRCVCVCVCVCERERETERERENVCVCVRACVCVHWIRVSQRANNALTTTSALQGIKHSLHVHAAISTAYTHVHTHMRAYTHTHKHKRTHTRTHAHTQTSPLLSRG